jgi:surface polysaccharide O-acyltransferase-like enzyme
VALLAGILFLALGPLLSGTSSPGSSSRHHHLVVAVFSSPHVFVWIPAGLAGAALGIGTIAIRRPARWIFLGFVVFTLEALVALRTHAPSSTGYARAGLLVTAIGAVAAARYWSAPPRWLVTLGRYSLGVFLVHPLLLWALRPVVSSMGLRFLPLSVAAVVSASMLLVMAMGRTPLRILLDGRWTRLQSATPSPG